MEEEKRSMCICTPQLENNIPVELINCIQSFLPAKEAARTCVLSKSWLHAWSTIPTLEFPHSTMMVSQEEDIKYMKLFDGTLQRYLQNKIPIKPFDLCLEINKHESSSLAENWIQSIVSKSFYKKIHLTFRVKIDSFTLPEKIFASKNLHTIIVSVFCYDIDSGFKMSNPVMIMSSSVINCVSLRVLGLYNVNISDEVLDRILSTCSLLEKINLIHCKGLKTFKVKSLRYLSELTIKFTEEDNTLEMNDVPSLHLFVYESLFYCKPLQCNMDSLRSLTELHLDGVIIDNALLDMINSKLLLLVTLYLKISFCNAESLNITSASLKRLILVLHLQENKQIEIQVYAPKLLNFCFTGWTMPKLLFPTINSPETIDLQLYVCNPIDHFLDRISKALNVSCKFNIEIIFVNRNIIMPVDVDVDNLKKKFPFPSANVQKLSFMILSDDCWREQGLLLDAFFSVCHPKYLQAYHLACKSNTFCNIMELMVSGMKKRKTYDLNDVKVNNPHNGNWETLTNSWRRIPNESAYHGHFIEFELNWCS